MLRVISGTKRTRDNKCPFLRARGGISLDIWQRSFRNSLKLLSWNLRVQVTIRFCLVQKVLVKVIQASVYTSLYFIIIDTWTL